MITDFPAHPENTPATPAAELREWRLLLEDMTQLDVTELSLVYSAWLNETAARNFANFQVSG